MTSSRLLAASTVLLGGVIVGVGVGVGVGVAASAAPVANCVAAHLRISLGPPQGAAGTIFYPLVVTNVGVTCRIWGVAGVQPVRATRQHGMTHLAPVGPHARNQSMGEMAVRHVVSPRGSVSDALGVIETGNYTARTCVAQRASGVVVTLAGFVTRAYVPLRITVCTKLASTTTRLLAAGPTGV